MASEYFLEPEINLVTENTENILSEGKRGPGGQGGRVTRQSWEKGQDQGRVGGGRRKGVEAAKQAEWLSKEEGRGQGGAWITGGRGQHKGVWSDQRRCGLGEGCQSAVE